MKQKAQDAKEKLTGRQGFEHYYKSLFPERWEALESSFLQEASPVEYKVAGAQKSYFLDIASVYAALCLPLENAENILDLCAAPGGKTVVLASRMNSSATLFANERSPERKKRLAATVETCLPGKVSARVKVSCSDGATWCRRQTECFDRILLDAPCSSERHVYNDEKYLSVWSPSRIKTVTTEQWALLSCAYRLLSPGGILLYSTCALCSQENDGMIERLVKKFGKDCPPVFLEPCPRLEEIAACIPSGLKIPSYEKTVYGYHILPDANDGAGPIFFSIISKQNSI